MHASRARPACLLVPHTVAHGAWEWGSAATSRKRCFSHPVSLTRPAPVWDPAPVTAWASGSRSSAAQDDEISPSADITHCDRLAQYVVGTMRLWSAAFACRRFPSRHVVAGRPPEMVPTVESMEDRLPQLKTRARTKAKVFPNFVDS